MWIARLTSICRCSTIVKYSGIVYGPSIYHIILKPFHSFRRLAGVDRAVFYSILSKAFSTAGSLITIPLILTRLTAVEQGFYYTFGSILALQVFLEMGFGAVAVQMVAHEAAHLKIDLKSGMSGQVLHLDRFSAIIRFVRNWYAVLSLLVGIVLFPAGGWFFSTSDSGPSAAWFGPWTIMVIAAAAGVFVNSLCSIIEGMGFVAESIHVRLWGGATQILLTIAGLLAGFRLYAVPLASAVALIINFGLAWCLLRNVTRETSSHGQEVHIDWSKRGVCLFNGVLRLAGYPDGSSLALCCRLCFANWDQKKRAASVWR